MTLKDIFEKRLYRALLIMLIILLNVGCDQQTKVFAEENLRYEGIHSYLNGFFLLQYTENTGAFLSMGDDWPPVINLIFLKIFPLILLIGMTFYILRSREISGWQAVAFSFIIGGGFSNVLDRIIRDGAVIDFMNLGIGDFRTGIFNFADVSIMFGLGVLLFLHFTRKKSLPSVSSKSSHQEIIGPQSDD